MGLKIDWLCKIATSVFILFIFGSIPVISVIISAPLPSENLLGLGLLFSYLKTIWNSPCHVLFKVNEYRQNKTNDIKVNEPITNLFLRKKRIMSFIEISSLIESIDLID